MHPRSHIRFPDFTSAAWRVGGASQDNTTSPCGAVRRSAETDRRTRRRSTQRLAISRWRATWPAVCLVGQGICARLDPMTSFACGVLVQGREDVMFLWMHGRRALSALICCGSSKGLSPIPPIVKSSCLISVDILKGEPQENRSLLQQR